MVQSSARHRNAFFLAAFTSVLCLATNSLWMGIHVAPVDFTGGNDISSPRSVASKELPARAAKNITVMVDLRAGWRDWGFSFMEADQLQLYGRCNYKMDWFHFTQNPNRLHQLANDPSSDACILVSNPKGLDEIREQYAPHCKTWIINDEYCTFQGNIRHYFKQQNASMELFVPLGPRYDFDRAYRQRHAGLSTSELRSNPPPVLPSSQRRYIFNAIFSKSTSASRKDLKTMLLQSPKYTVNTTTESYNKGTPDYFIQIPAKWRRQMHPEYHVNSNQYVEILSQSKFTLSPSGHNVECFRIWESILVGSIPIVAVGDEEYQSHKCPNALQPVLESALRDADVPEATIQQVVAHPDRNLDIMQEKLPFVVLNNWTLLTETINHVLHHGPDALDERQTRLQNWYYNFMKERVAILEDYVLTRK